MVGILLLILKMIGIFIAVIVCMILLLLFIVLFAPFSYNVNGEFHNELDSLHVAGRGRWLFGILKIDCELKSSKLDWSGRFLWFNLAETASDTHEKTRKTRKNKKEAEFLKIEKELEEAYTRGDSIEDIDIEKIEKDVSEQGPKKIKVEKKRIKRERSKIRAFFRKIKILINNIKRKFKNISNTIKGICDTIKSLLEKKDKVIAFYYMEVHQYAIAKIKSQIFYLFKRLKPKKFMIKGRLGFEDPSITGKFIGFMSVLYPIYGNAIDVIPDFQNKIYDMTVELKGKIRIFPFVVVLIRMLLDEKIRKTYRNIRGFKL